MERKLSGFAEACYDQNTADELVAALTREADPADLYEWDIEPEEYYAALSLALAARLGNCGEPEQLAAQCGCGGLCDSKEPCPMAYNAKAAR